MGAHRVFNRREDGYTDAIKDAAEGRGPGVIIEMAAHANLMKDLDMLARCGRIAVTGSRGGLDFDSRAAMTKDAVILGMNIINMPPAARARRNISDRNKTAG